MKSKYYTYEDVVKYMLDFPEYDDMEDELEPRF